MYIFIYCLSSDISDSSEDVSAGSGPARGLQMEVGNMDEHGGNTCDSELLQHMVGLHYFPYFLMMTYAIYQQLMQLCTMLKLSKKNISP